MEKSDVIFFGQLLCLGNTLDKVNACLPPTMAALQLVPPCQRGGQVSVVVTVRPSPDRVATTPPLQLRPAAEGCEDSILERFHLFAHNFPKTYNTIHNIVVEFCSLCTSFETGKRCISGVQLSNDSMVEISVQQSLPPKLFYLSVQDTTIIT